MREFRLWRIFARSTPGKRACRSPSGKCEPIAQVRERTALRRFRRISKKTPPEFGWWLSYTGISSQMNIPTPFSLRLGHTQGKTIINRFLRPSCRFATLKASFQIFGWGMRTHSASAQAHSAVSIPTNQQKNTTRIWVVSVIYGNFITDEYTHTLRLESKLSNLRVGYANP